MLLLRLWGLTTFGSIFFWVLHLRSFLVALHIAMYMAFRWISLHYFIYLTSYAHSLPNILLYESLSSRQLDLVRTSVQIDETKSVRTLLTFSGLLLCCQHIRDLDSLLCYYAVHISALHYNASSSQSSLFSLCLWLLICMP